MLKHVASTVALQAMSQIAAYPLSKIRFMRTGNRFFLVLSQPFYSVQAVLKLL